MTDEQLRALLRLKRYEQPPPGYFDQLLTDLHRRQRAELLRRPLWKIAIERVQTFFGEHSMSHVAYGGAMATALVIGTGIIGMLTTEVEPVSGGRIASTAQGSATALTVSAGPLSQVAPVPATLTGTGPTQPPTEGALLTLQNPRGSSLAKLPPQRSFPAASSTPANGNPASPRYIIDARPVSYEPSFSF